MKKDTPHRRALTLIETVAAVVLLSLLAAAVLGALSGVVAQQTRQNRRMQAMELANRLMLQYLDDPNLMPTRNMPVAYGKERYRWDVAETPVRLVPALTDVAAEQERRSALDWNRIKVITLHVWLGEESGGAMGFTEVVPSATLVRLMDPVAGLYRNPDTMTAILADDKRKREVFAMFQDTAAGGLVNRPSNPSTPTTLTGSGSTGKGGTGKGSTGKGGGKGSTRSSPKGGTREAPRAPGVSPSKRGSGGGTGGGAK